MGQYTYAASQRPSQSTVDHWNRQLSYFAHHPADPNARQGSRDGTDWGIPEWLKPPKDAVELTIALFKREVAQKSQDEKLLPEVKFSIITTLMAHFLWFTRQGGAKWLMRFYGIEEVQPFSQAYVFYYVEPTSKYGFEISDRTKMNLRIFQPCERCLEAPVKLENGQSQVFDELKKLLEKVRCPFADEPLPHNSSGMYAWVSGKLRDWFYEPKPDYSFPYNKTDRISGYQWARMVKRPDGNLRYGAIEKMELYKDRCYRIEDERGGIIWAGPKDMVAVSAPDYIKQRRERGEDQRPERVVEDEIRGIYECATCHQIRPCLTVTGSHKMCCHCFGSTVEKDQRPTLDLCMTKECKSCPMWVRERDDLNNLKTRLNRPVQFPVQRPGGL